MSNEKLVGSEHPDVEFVAPKRAPRTMNVPYYVDPRTLQIGAVVSDDEDPNHARLVVTNIEPALIVADLAGNERVLLAHMATVLDDHPSPYCPCDICRSRLP